MQGAYLTKHSGHKQSSEPKTKLEANTCSAGKPKRAGETRLVLVLLLIGSKRGAIFHYNQSLSEVERFSLSHFECRK